MPVLETLGGALFGAVLQMIFDKLDSHQVLHYFRGRNLDEKLLKKLKRNLMDINAVIDDAEQKQFSNSLVKEWIDEVRDVLYDAEDLLEQIDYEFSKTMLKAEFQTSSSKVHSFESKIIALIDDLEYLLNQKIVKNLKVYSGDRSGFGNKVSEKKVESTSLVAEEVIYGRDKDKEIIFSWLTSDTNDNKLSILSIVGMGGMGKTTLAQHVYNDPKTEEANFDEKAWVCVSDAFDALRVSKTIIGAFTNSIYGSGDLEMVHGKLKTWLPGKKFLLVLDDVWNEDRNQWKALQTPLTFGAKGSKIIVTTRSHKVASIMQSTYILQLKQLDEDHSWETFAKHAFQDENSKLNSELKEIGMKIVEKCQGLPLALETIGCLLQSKSSVSEWEGVLTSEIWDLPIEDSKIVPTLLLSYYHLPSHLKRCFAYCAIFPKDYRFDKESLILLWMAQNFLYCSQQSKSLEEVGENYFNDLVSRSFFKQIIRNKKTYFVMHDLLNDLAKYVSGEICYRLGVDDEKRVSRKTRHLSYESGPIQCDTSLCDAKGLRTFITLSCDRKISIEELISNCKFLRVLSLHWCFTVPDSIGDLIHLRLLDLSNSNIKRLPDSTCSLYNLQELKLNDCMRLKELPLTLHELTNLRRLELMGNTLIKALPHLGKLKNLHVWMGMFEVGKNSEFSIRQLGELDLHGRLSIKSLENIANPYEMNLKNKRHIVRLSLQWNLKENNADSMKQREVLENLQPSRHLKYLSIDGYGGTQFPRWLYDNSLSNVVSLTLKHCKYCLLLPSLGLLTFLKHLAIDGLDQILRIDADFYGNSSSAFPSLEILSFTNMKEWEEWQCMKGAFPCLQSLSLMNCPKLKGNLPEQLSLLKRLSIRRCEQLGASIPLAIEMEGVKMEPSSFDMIGPLVSDTPLEFLYIDFCPGRNIPINHCYYFLVDLNIKKCCDSLTNFSLDLFPKLSHLSLNRCHNLQMISQGHTHGHLKSLEIKKCPQFESFPNDGLFAPQLETFSIKGLEKLKSMPKCMSALLPSLNQLYIHSCPVVELSEGCLPSNVKKMSLLHCSKLVASLKGAWGTNHSLKVLDIGNVDVECFPGEGLLPLSLSYLEISDCPNLKKLDFRGLCQLSSLQNLTLLDCPILQYLPEEGLPKSISLLVIENCPLLK
ncbi:putative disease resistance RPP13-like protein 1 [Vigna umbellata]|uniref:putative disease resistance RPP13-like protein 1 n=1 Tax=Vigna umbellata TaxID=87088 RepID=UPI001F5F3100|nr:putative disease resistance RPP13-like protein 1 [Vigna umbellata]XP_047150642.1 putative disease resistance RPP13-like protein 1 [Vigna umbellata]